MKETGAKIIGAKTLLHFLIFTLVLSRENAHYDLAFHDLYLRPIIAAFRKPFPQIKYISLYANQIFKEPRIGDNK